MIWSSSLLSGSVGGGSEKNALRLPELMVWSSQLSSVAGPSTGVLDVLSITVSSSSVSSGGGEKDQTYPYD